MTMVRGNSSSYATEGFVVTPSDTVDIAAPFAIRGFQVTTEGQVTVDFQTSGTAIPLWCLAGAVYPYGVKRIRATGTTTLTGITVVG